MKKLTNDEFIVKAISIHGEKYDYSLSEYQNSKEKVKIICKNHGIFGIEDPIQKIREEKLNEILN